MIAQDEATKASMEAEQQVRDGISENMSTSEKGVLLEAAFQAGRVAAQKSRLGDKFRANMTDEEYETALVELDIANRALLDEALKKQ